MRCLLTLCIFLSALSYGYSSSIQGTIFYDDDLDGCRNSTEELSEQISVQLYVCNENSQPNSNDLLVAETESNEFGFYSFDGIIIPDGKYYLIIKSRHDNPTSKGSCNPENDSDINEDGTSDCFEIKQGDTVILDAGLVARMTLGGRIFSDFNANGIFDPGEKNIGDEGKTITLELVDKNLEFLMEITSDARGSYYFELAPGQYYVRFTPPVTFPVSSPGSSPSDNGIYGDDNGEQQDTNGDGITNGPITSSLITLTRGAEPVNEPNQEFPVNDANSNMTVDFGLSTCRFINGFVFEDENLNGCLDLGESGIPPNVTLYLCDDSLEMPSPLGEGLVIVEETSIESLSERTCLTYDKSYYIEVDLYDDRLVVSEKDICADSIDTDVDKFGQSDCFDFKGDYDVENIHIGLSFRSSTSDPLESDFLIFPNPATDLLSIEAKNKILALNIMDISGKSVIHEDFQYPKQEEKIDVSNIGKGTYIIEVQMKNQIRYKKFVKE